MNCSLLAILVVVTIAAESSAQVSGGSFGEDTRIFLDDWGTVLTSPGSFNGEDWMLLGAAIGMTAAAWTADEEVRDWTQQRRTPALDDWVLAGDYYGSGEFNIGVAVLFYAAGEVFDDSWSRTTGRMVFQSLMYSEFFTFILKTVTGRSRPYVGKGNMDFSLFSFAFESTSFPSGHTTAAFALSTVLSRRVGNPAVSVLLFSFASLTVSQRIVSDNQWLSDTVLGAVIGTATAWAVTELENERDRQKDVLPISTAPFRPHAPLIRIGFSF